MPKPFNLETSVEREKDVQLIEASAPSSRPLPTIPVGNADKGFRKCEVTLLVLCMDAFISRMQDA